MQNFLLSSLSQEPLSNPILNGTLQNFSNTNNPEGFFSKILSNSIVLIFVVGVIIFFFMLITGAIAWISSGGDKNSLESARGKISNALIGLIILFASFAIMKLIETFFGIKILSLDIGSLVIQ